MLENKDYRVHPWILCVRLLAYFVAIIYLFRLSFFNDSSFKTYWIARSKKCGNLCRN